MTPPATDLYQRLVEFPIDEGNPPLSFEARLTRENGWSRGYTRRVIVEYKRFLFLAATSVEPVCPSEDVDAAWHLHLTYTRSYWTRLCGEVLGRPLHHDPSPGGAAEADKHRRMYDRTLAVYREAFGQGPPADIWPPTEVRFGGDPSHRVVSASPNRAIPKPTVRRGLALGLVALLCGTGCVGGVQPAPIGFWLVLLWLGGVILICRNPLPNTNRTAGGGNSPGAGCVGGFGAGCGAGLSPDPPSPVADSGGGCGTGCGGGCGAGCGGG